MRFISLLSVALLANGCENFNNNFGLDDTDDDTDSSGIDGTEADSDTEEDSDTDPDTDTGITGTAGDCHPVDPLDMTGWSRTYETNWEGKLGTEVQTAQGQGIAPNGDAAYVIHSVITLPNADPATPDDTLELDSYRNCSNGEATWLGEDVTGTTTTLLFDILPVATTIESTVLVDDGVPYLPSFATLQAGSRIEYNFEMMSTKAAPGADDIGAIFEGIFGSGGSPNCSSTGSVIPQEFDSTCVEVDGYMEVFGAGNRVVNGTTWYAYEIVDVRTELWGAANAGGGAGGIPGVSIFDIFGALFGAGGTTDQQTTRQIWYVEGIGIVEEKAYDTTIIASGGGSISESDLIVTRKLTSFT